MQRQTAMRLALAVAVTALLVSPIVAAQDAPPSAAPLPIVPLPVVPAPLVSPALAPAPPPAPPPAASVATTATAASAAAYANRSGAFGVGVNIGNRVSGASLKLWASPGVAAEATAGGGAEGNDLRAHVGLDFSLAQWASPDGQYLLPIYLGIGGVLGHTFASGAIASGTEAGFRVPVGMSVLVRANPVELFFEVAPELTIASTASPSGKYVVAADGAIGFRYYL